MFKHYFKFLLLSFLMAGCMVTPPSVPKAEVTRLSFLLQSLESDISNNEAKQLSQDIFRKTKALTKEFELTSPPVFHNFLVNVGLREKGLCYHWSDALYAYLSDKGYDSFEFHLAGANIGEYFYEHNALVVVAKGRDIQQGVIIDPWRDSGKLYFSTVKSDVAYRWKHRPARGCH